MMRIKVSYELGFHLKRECWSQGYAYEAAKAVIDHAFSSIICAKKLYAGYHPENVVSGKLLKKLGFVYSHDEYYAPTRLKHPSYFLSPS